ncbi:hypothetical protein SK128_016253 [Halocaridina rubra]|uniref:Nuclear pore complex protein Nup88 n=1 Tax=Halocaridina rubra TaxID=373956 RepID=A0AAN8ZUT3_HALRR
MASSTENRQALSLNSVLLEKYNDINFRKDSPNHLLCKADDILMAWSKEDVCLYAQMVNPPDSHVQTLALSKPPVWDVKKIVLNSSGSFIALIGQRGVAVVELPQRYGTPSLYDRGREVVMCRVEYIAERFFSCHPKLEVVSCAWHPGAVDQDYVVILASDNYLRIYNLASQEIPEQAILVASNTNVLNTSTCERAATLGESAVDFGFGPPSEQTKKIYGNPVSSRLGECIIDPEEEFKAEYLALQWPVFILYGNGEVCYVNTTLGPNRAPFHSVYGPLTMTPPSEDNYGVDSCSLLVLQSYPPVLVIATSSGMLHHCIVYDSSNEEDESLNPSRSLAVNGSQLSLPTSTRLHVYERVELELSLRPDDEAFACPLSLLADPYSLTRYWVTHEAGVHGVTFPLVEHLLQHIELAEDALFMSNESQCIVDHIVCTRSMSSAEPLPVIGLVGGSNSELYVLLASGSIISLRCPSTFLPQMTATPSASTSESVSPLRKVHIESFEDHIRTILHRSSSQPILASGSDAPVTGNEYLNLLNRVTETLRTNYLQPQLIAKEDTRKRSDILKEQHQRLQLEIGELHQSKVDLTAKAHDLAEKYEEANDKNAQLIERFERILTQVMRCFPGLTVAEKNMFNELEAIHKQTTSLSSQLQQMEEKAKWQTSQMEKLLSNEATKSHYSPNLSESQIKALSQALGKEGEKIGILVERLNQLKHDLPL